MSSGALTPQKAVETTFHDGMHHLNEPIQLAFLKNVAGGLQVGVAGLTSIVIAGGCPGIKAANPGITHLIEGSLFAVGLVLVYFTGAELFTGYPMWLAICAWNLVGAVGSAALFSYATGVFDEEPWRSYLIERVDDTIVHSEWHLIFLKAIVCGYLVTLAMLLGTQNMDGISKALGLWLPFALATSSQFPHTVEFMHLASSAMMYGASLSVGAFFWKCLLPIILGNTVGGAIFTGIYNWWIFMQCKNGKQDSRSTFGDTVNQYRDDEDN